MFKKKRKRYSTMVEGLRTGTPRVSGRGWHGEPLRHSEAARGIRTRIKQKKPTWVHTQQTIRGDSEGRNQLYKHTTLKLATERVIIEGIKIICPPAAPAIELAYTMYNNRPRIQEFLSEPTLERKLELIGSEIPNRTISYIKNEASYMAASKLTQAMDEGGMFDISMPGAKVLDIKKERVRDFFRASANELILNVLE